jgi:hypothetical protein
MDLKDYLFAKKELLDSQICGCFYCEKTFYPIEIIEWIKETDSNETAMCPKCGIDSVLSEKYPILDKTFLSEMNKLWF